MEDDLERLRRMRPDRVEPDDPPNPAVFVRMKEQLMSQIAPTGPEASIGATPDVYPRLAYNDQLAALEFLDRVFQLHEIREARMDNGDHVLAWLRVGTGIVMLGPPNEDVHQIVSPQTTGTTSVQMMVYVDDVDAHHAHAAAEGADITMPLRDAFYGDRVYEATDLEGHRWHFGERFAHIVARGGPSPEPEERPDDVAG
jgi:uncharacterized glyoxalase superfamily protein PhnB